MALTETSRQVGVVLRRRAIDNRRGIACGYYSAFFEYRFQSGQPLNLRLCSNIVVLS